MRRHFRLVFSLNLKETVICNFLDFFFQTGEFTWMQNKVRNEDLRG
jgi:hypothetical protein